MTKVLLLFSDRLEPFGAYGQLPPVCLFEDEHTGERWLRCDDGPVYGAVWQQAKSLGIAGLTRTDPSGCLWYVATEHADMHGEFTNAKFSVDDRWWVQNVAPVLPVVPELVTGLILARAPFVHLHAHSEHSALDGLATIEEMVDKIAEDNQGALAITDHGTCAGHPVLQEVCLARGVKPIFGIEANLVEDRFSKESSDYWHFLLFAMNEVGLRNLWAASTAAYTEGFYYRSRMDFDILERYSEGVLASTACLRGPLSRLIHQGDESGARAMLSRLQGIYPGRLCVELQTCAVEYDEKPEKGGLHFSQRFLNEALVSLAHDVGLPLIVVSDAHYARCEDFDLHKVWIAVQTNKDLTDDQDLFAGDEKYYLKTAAEVAESIAYLGAEVVAEAMQNTVYVAEACDVTIKQRMSTPVYHRVGHEDGKAQDVLVMERICREGWDRKIVGLDPSLLETTYNADGTILREGYRPRFDREFEMLVSKGFAGYFLVVWDYCNWSRQQGALMGPGRGSVVGSLVAWLMGITGIDPIEADLMFERFITAGRTSPPDIDLDFPSSFRTALIDYLIERWGVQHVVRVGTITRLKNKGVFVKLAAALKQTYEDRGTPIDYADIKKISEIITKAEAHTAGAGLKWDELWEQEAELLDPYREKYPDMVGTADRLVKRLSNYGKHPSGIIIDPENDVLSELPLRIPNNSDHTVVTQFDMVMAEFLGYLKFDILTIRNLDTIQMALDLIHNDVLNGGLVVNPEVWKDEYNDPQVWDMLCSGDTLGVFQIETASGTQLVRQMQPRSIPDLAAILTLVRPGPVRSGLTAQYIARRDGREEVTHIDPRMAFVLRKTYGCMIYQEDIMGVCSALAGYDLEESDKIRGILGKKKVELAVKEGKRFIERAIAYGVHDEAANRIWKQMEQFAKYCVVGDTKIMLAGAGPDSDGWLPVEQAYRRIHVDGHSPWRSKFRSPDRGVYGMAVHPDGRIRKCRVLDVQQAGEQHVVTITLANGMTLTATPDHRHLTPNGLLCVDDGLAVGHELIVNAGYEQGGYVPERDRTTVGDRQGSGVVNGAFEDDNYGYINGGFASLSAWTAQTPKICAECGHDGSEHRIERAHLDGNRQNNDWVNLRMLCVSCHKRYDYEHNARRRHGEKGLASTTSEIVSIDDAGVQMTYDVMMDEPHIWIANGIATTNTFNRAHAWSYAQLAYWCSWLKCHFPAYFYVALLRTVDENARLPEFVEGARRSGYLVQTPDVNQSDEGFTVGEDRLSIRYGFRSIPGVGDAAASAIIENRPYASWDDFVERRGSKCNWGSIKTLASLGTFDTLIPEGHDRASLEALVALQAEGKDDACTFKVDGLDGPGGLPCTFDWTGPQEVQIGKSGKPLKSRPLPKQCTRGCRHYTPPTSTVWPQAEPMTPRMIGEREHDTLGVYLTWSPFDTVEVSELERIGATFGPAVETMPAGVNVVYGIVSNVKEHVDSQGRTMAFVQINSMGYMADVTVFSKAYPAYKQYLRKGSLVFVEVDTNSRGSTFRDIVPIQIK